MPIKKTADIKKPLYLVGLLLIVQSWVKFITNNPTAFEWPAIDAGPFIERYFNKSFALQDFYTNAEASYASPRHIFNYIIIYISKFLHLHWYDVFFLLKTIFVITIPFFLYLSFFSLLKNKIQNQLQYFLANIFLIIFISIAIHAPYVFSIAWYQPLAISVNPHNLAFLLSLVGLLLFIAGNKDNKKLTISYILYFFAVIIHPALGLSSIVFSCILQADQKHRYKDFLLLFVISGILPAVILQSLYSSNAILSTNEFVENYVVSRHPWHYLPSHFGSIGTPWYINFIELNIFFLLVALIAYKIKNLSLVLISLLAGASYAGCVALQYFLVELYSIKIIAVLGPSRYSLYGYWLAIYCLVCLIISLTKKSYSFPAINFSFLTSLYKTEKIIKPAYHILAMVMLLTYAQFYFKDNPFDISREPVLSWIEKNTDKNAIFASYDYLPEIPLLAKRNVVVGNGFAFNEAVIKENTKRSQDLFGTPTERAAIKGGASLAEKEVIFFHNISKERFQLLAKKYNISYIIFNNKYISKDFSNLPSPFKNDKFTIIAINKIK